MRLYLYVVASVLCVFAQCHASVVVSGTRVVFSASEREVSVKLRNEGDTPGLVQVWLDHGDRDDVPEHVKVPFVVTPPLFRLDPRQGQTVRILSTDETLPEDRETLFWLNVLEVPPKPDASDAKQQNLIQMAFRTRIKLFYRPASLNKPQDVEDAYGRIVWTVREEGHHKAVLEAHNPTPYFITITKFRIGDDAPDTEAPAMLAPFHTHRFTTAFIASDAINNQQVTFSVINDYGSEVNIKAAH
jgi:chaperone protein EcpD